MKIIVFGGKTMVDESGEVMHLPWGIAAAEVVMMSIDLRMHSYAEDVSEAPHPDALLKLHHRKDEGIAVTCYLIDLSFFAGTLSLHSSSASLYLLTTLYVTICTSLSTYGNRRVYV